MLPHLRQHFGNPSSIHSHGREARSAIEKARKKIAEILQVAPAEIFFTSGGTEADNTVLRRSAYSYGFRHAISTRIEHHAVLHTLQAMEREQLIALHYLPLDGEGYILPGALEEFLEQHGPALVSLMHVNNEIGNLTDLPAVAEICQSHGAFLHSDAVQSIGYYAIQPYQLGVDALAASAHKFHGPKGVGFMYLSAQKKLDPMMHGGGQERNMRGGTEHVAGIVGMARALELAVEEMDINRRHIEGLKQYAIDQLKTHFPNVTFNGGSGYTDRSHYKIINISVPGIDDNDMLLFHLDINQISVSGGSACSSGTNIGSHVLEAIQPDLKAGTLRISFSKHNTKEEIDYLIQKLSEQR
jgi:cysteine desulfurase